MTLTPRRRLNYKFREGVWDAHPRDSRARVRDRAAAGSHESPRPLNWKRWKNEPAAKVMETSPCRKITWMLESDESDKNPIRIALGGGDVDSSKARWHMVPGDKASKAASDFGLSVDVVAAHIKTYCYSHEQDNALRRRSKPTAEGAKPGRCAAVVNGGRVSDGVFMPQRSRLSSGLSGVAGEYFAAAELLLRGHRLDDTPRIRPPDRYPRLEQPC